MSMRRIYRLSLRLLPADLRRKHGDAMENLFARELTDARTRGRVSAAATAFRGVADVLQRALYETVRLPDSQRESDLSATPMVPLPSARELLRRHAASFVTACVVLTSVMLWRYDARWISTLRAQHPSFGLVDAARVVCYSIPFTAALTIPMAVFMSVLYEFTRLGARDVLSAARKQRFGVRRLMRPVVAAASVVSIIAFAVTAELVPRANALLVAAEYGRATVTDRTMTIGELRSATRPVAVAADRITRERVASYEVEVQKKFAIPATCVVFALLGMALAFQMPRGGKRLVLGASMVVFVAYYAVLTAGEDLAERLVVSPFLAMWSANAMLLAVALLLAARRRSGDGPTTALH